MLCEVTDAARTRLIARHRTEYEALVDEERAKRGLGPSMRSRAVS
jgi:hypothetical protein